MDSGRSAAQQSDRPTERLFSAKMGRRPAETAARAVLDRYLPALHDLLVLLLIGLRALIGGAQPLGLPGLLWAGLLCCGLCACLLESWTGLRRRWRWAPGGVIGLLVLLCLMPAAARATLPLTQGWNWWVEWLLLLLFAVYLLQVLPGRLRLATAALGGALAVTAVLALAQALWVLPAMATDLAAPDGAMAALARRFGSGLVAERIAQGGTYATLALANALAVFLVIGGLLLAAALLQRWRSDRAPRRTLLVPGLVLLGAAAAYLTTGARGAIAAAATAVAIAAAWQARGWPRLLLPLGVAAAACAAWASGALDASIGVRAGYWGAAFELIGRTPLRGYGLDGFAEHAAAVLPVNAEYSRHVHNSLLEATVAGGLLAGLALLALFLALARAPRPACPHEPPRERHGRLVWVYALALPYCAAFGALVSDNLGFWPCGSHLGPILFYAALLGLLQALVARALMRLPPPSHRVWWLATLCFLCSCLIDFHCFNPGLLGIAIVTASAAGIPAARSCAHGVTTRSLVSLGLLALLVLIVHIGWRQLEAARADEALTLLEQAASAGDDQREKLVAQACALVGEPRAGRPMAQAGHACATRAAALADGLPPGRDALIRAAALRGDAPMLERLAAQVPHHARIWVLLATAWTAHRRLEPAIAALRRAVALNPAALPLQLRLATLLDARAAELQSARAARLRQEADALRQRVRELNPVVHPANRTSLPLGTP
ncbi:MAG: hypothetical protein ACOCYP_03050 [Planctomycetota bacterium]